MSYSLPPGHLHADGHLAPSARRDPTQLGKLMVDIAIGQVVDAVEDGKNQAAAELGRTGGAARAKSLKVHERSAADKKAAWGDGKR